MPAEVAAPTIHKPVVVMETIVYLIRILPLVVEAEATVEAIVPNPAVPGAVVA